MNGRKVLSRLGWAYTVFFLASTAVQYLIVLASAAAPEPWQKFLWNDNVTMILSQASMYLAGFPLCFLTLRRLPAWHRRGIEESGEWSCFSWLYSVWDLPTWEIFWEVCWRRCGI